jgi:hypothetical protein
MEQAEKEKTEAIDIMAHGAEREKVMVGRLKSNTHVVLPSAIA